MKNYLIISIAFILGFFITAGLYMTLTKKYVVIVSPLALSQFSLLNAPTKSLYGQITNITGDVFWQSRVATQSSPLKNARQISQGEEVDTGDNGQAQISFTNILNINLSNNSELSVIQTLPANFVFDLKSGISVFQKLDSTVPVSIRGLDLLINIQKGEYKIAVNKDSTNITLIVATGEATVAYTDTNDVSIVKTIQEGQKFVFINNTKTFVLY